MSSETTVLADDRLYVLSNSYELDGRVSSHPVAARGYAPMQTYLAKEGDRAVLIGTGLTIHQDKIIEQLAPLIGSARLSIMPLGLDFTRICNARPIADRYGAERIFEPVNRGDIPGVWLNVRPEFAPGVDDALGGAEIHLMRSGVPISIDDAGVRSFELLVPGMRLLANSWLYDAATKTLFTLDVFTWVWRDTDDGPWTLGEHDDDPTTVETVMDALLKNRYWWLAGAETERIRRDLDEVFETHDVENIAPDCGCVLKGAEVVERHRQLLDESLVLARGQAPIGVEVGKWRFSGATA